ncbi:MAG: hypothetical protein L6Q71_02140 [Planctomycetes bacterium]|nr:hypothetical protein [Planctomycetota bacterium]NUQ34832.1 hypothetical protein [Planctomycetaceae bacterium]
MANIYDYYYENYLMLYSLYGRGRPTVDRERFEALDKELIGYMSQATDSLSPAHASRIGEIEYLLLDDISEALLDKEYEERMTQSAGPAKSTRPSPRLALAPSPDSGRFQPLNENELDRAGGSSPPEQPPKNS